MFTTTPQSSDTNDFVPSIGECVLNAFSRIRIRAGMVKAEHMSTAQMEANLMQQQWNNRGPNLWKVSETVFEAEPGVQSYPIDPAVVMVSNVTVGTGDPPNEQQLTITPVSRTIWSMYPNREQRARPTSYWFDRQLSPTLNLWPVPNMNYWIHVWGYSMMFAAKTQKALNFDMPPLWLDAACAGMSHRLARHYAQDLEGQRKGDADEAYKIAADQNTEDSPVYFVPMLASYYR
jgi:hypothetical protein